VRTTRRLASGPELRAFDASRSERKADLGFNRYLFFGAPYVAEPGPQIYINDLDPAVGLPAHFHKVDQFQLFFGTPGAVLGRQPLSSAMVHYTDAYSTYGPFSAGPEASLKYATIRAIASTFGGVMPAARDELLYRGRRHFTVDLEPHLAPTTDVVVNDLVKAEDGLAVSLVTLPPLGSTRFDVPAGVTGRAYCVVTGELVDEHGTYGMHSLGWSEPSSSAVLAASAAGAAVAVMDFPFPATPVARLAERPDSAPD
jgi:hypothetical protein